MVAAGQTRTVLEVDLDDEDTVQTLVEKYKVREDGARGGEGARANPHARARARRQF